MNYDVNYFIKKFEAIPKGLWEIGDWGSNNRHCANGHCGVNSQNFVCDPNTEAKALNGLFKNIHLTTNSHYKGYWFGKVAIINDGDCIEYKQPTPKQRILAALYDIKKMQEPEVKEKVVVKYVAVDAAIKEMELVEN